MPPEKTIEWVYRSHLSLFVSVLAMAYTPSLPSNKMVFSPSPLQMIK